jgi:hypothetical protein
MIFFTELELVQLKFDLFQFDHNFIQDWGRRGVLGGRLLELRHKSSVTNE